MNTTPIEFMAWSKSNGCFCGAFSVHKSGMISDMIDAKIDKDSGLAISDAHWGENDLELMQLTALRSINDEPIYNHMIVKDEIGDYYIVDMFNYDLMFLLSESHIEILGNRFQSPELLELCK